MSALRALPPQKKGTLKMDSYHVLLLSEALKEHHEFVGGVGLSKMSNYRTDNGRMDKSFCIKGCIHPNIMQKYL